jgi:hypothetical protein
MKTALLSMLTATLLGIASLASGRPFDGTDFTAILFATGLVAWTINQYHRAPRALHSARLFRMPVGMKGRPAQNRGFRVAA